MPVGHPVNPQNPCFCLKTQILGGFGGDDLTFDVPLVSLLVRMEVTEKEFL